MSDFDSEVFDRALAEIVGDTQRAELRDDLEAALR
jgi:hypothetical protein